jgi:hypothetical protein
LSTTIIETVPVYTGAFTVTVVEVFVVGITEIPLNNTLDILDRLVPVIVTSVLVVPLIGVMLVRVGADIILNAEIIIDTSTE